MGSYFRLYSLVFSQRFRITSMKTPIPFGIFIAHIDLFSSHLPHSYQLDSPPELWHLFFQHSVAASGGLRSAFLHSSLETTSWHKAGATIVFTLLFFSSFEGSQPSTACCLLCLKKSMLCTFCPVFQFFCNWRANLVLVITLRLQMSVFSFEILLWTDLSEP